MEAGVELGSQIDPKAPLSNIDLAKFLMNDTERKVAALKEHIQESMRDDRNHFNEVINLVVTGNNQKIDKLVDCVLQNKEEFSKRVTDLELYTNTVSSYHEHHITTINDRIHDLFNALETMKGFLTENSSTSNTSLQGGQSIMNISEIDPNHHEEIFPYPSTPEERVVVTDADTNFSSSQTNTSSTLTSHDVSLIPQMDGNDTVVSRTS